MTPFQARALAVIASLRPGDVVTYGDVAHDAGNPGAARAIGHLLASTTDDVPWWRVVRSGGRLPPVAPREQARRLRADGVEVHGERVVHPRFSSPRPRPAPARRPGGSG